MTSTLLKGLRVVELCEVWAGPMAGSIFGDLGADVIKVESFPRNSMTRPLATVQPWPGEGPAFERSPIHHISNRNKRNLALNLRSEGGAEAMRRLLRDADVFFEGYSAGTVEGLGFGWDAARELNPRLVYLSLPGWGAKGPYQGYVTLGSGLDAAGGHTIVRGYPDHPVEDIQPIFHSDATGALAVVFAALTALRQREQTGEGAFVDISQIEVLNWHLPALLADWAVNRRSQERLGNTDPLIVPHRCYRSAGGEAGDDAWVFLAAEDDRQWRALAGVAGHPEWASRGHPWATIPGRLAHRNEIDAALAEFVASGTAEEIADRVSSAGGIAAPVIAPWSLLSNPQHQARNWLQYVDHRYVGTQVFPGFLWNVEPDAPSWDRPSGLVGECNREILTGLGYSEAEVEDLYAQGAVGDRYG